MSVSAIAIRETKNAQLIFCENMIEAEILFFTCYGAMTFWALMICLYLLLRRNNVFATDITSSLRLRRWMATKHWTAAFSFATVEYDHGLHGNDNAFKVNFDLAVPQIRIYYTF